MGADRGSLDPCSSATGDHVLLDATTFHCRANAGGDQGMSKFVTIGKGSLALQLRLPQVGMPEILSFANSQSAEEESTLGTIERSSRINGMDIAVPNAVILPLGGMGFFGWPAIAGHRMGQNFILQFANWEVEQDGQCTHLDAIDEVAEIGLKITLQAFGSGVISIATRITNQGKDDYLLERCMAGSFLIPAGKVDITGYRGMWGA